MVTLALLLGRWQVVSLYFIFLFWVTKPEKQQETAAEAGSPANTAPAAEPPAAEAEASAEAALTPTQAAISPPPLGVTKESISYALSAACVLCLCGELLSSVVFGGRVSAM